MRDCASSFCLATDDVISATAFLHTALKDYRIGEVFLLSGDYQDGEKREAFYMLITSIA